MTPIHALAQATASDVDARWGNTGHSSCDNFLYELFQAALSAPGILSPRKDHRRGRAQGRVAYGDGANATLEADLPAEIIL
jgi:hypothetical protein